MTKHRGSTRHAQTYFQAFFLQIMRTPVPSAEPASHSREMSNVLPFEGYPTDNLNP